MNQLFSFCLKTTLSTPWIKAFVILISAWVTHSRKGVPDQIARLFKSRQYSNIPWVRNLTPLSESKIAIVTVANIFVKGQPSFKEASFSGDFSFRVISKDVTPSKLSIAKRFIDRRNALLDVNMLFPIDRLKELAQEKRIKSVAENHYSFYSYVYNINRIIDGSAKDVARRLRYEGVDKALIIPASILCEENALLIQRSIEEEGVPTVSLSYTAERVRNIKPPRTCVLTKGSLCHSEEYLDERLQKNLLTFMLRQFDTIQEAGSVQKITLSLGSLEQTQKTSQEPEKKFEKEPNNIKHDLFE